jgi:hypothetical protein
VRVPYRDAMQSASGCVVKRPIVNVLLVDEATGITIHTETRFAFNAGIRASESAVLALARAERTTYEADKQTRVGDLYTRRWVSRAGRAVVATIDKPSQPSGE